MIDAKSASARCMAGILLFALSNACVRADDYDAASCQAIAGTLNVFWREVSGPQAPCTGIETTDGTLAEAATGSISMSGVTVSNPACIGTAAYSLTLSNSGNTLSGSDTQDNVTMNLVRGPGENCFVGHWVRSPYDYVAMISAAPFVQAAATVSKTPALSMLQLGLLVGLLGLLGCVGLKTHGQLRYFPQTLKAQFALARARRGFRNPTRNL